MSTTETSIPTYWYVFQRQSELRSVLFQCAPNVLMAPYRLWRFEHQGSGKSMLLLTVRHFPLPENWCESLKPQMIREEQSLFSGDTSHTDGRVRLTLENGQSGEIRCEGWAFPLRTGEHLLASLGFEVVPASTELRWVLFSIPSEYLHETIADHFTLHNHDLRCSTACNGRQWLWIRKPELYLILKYKEREEIKIYQSFPDEPSLFTPWGYRSCLSRRVRLPQDELLMVFDLAGGNQRLQTSSWWMASEVITIEELPTIQALRPKEGPPQIPVKLQYQHTNPLEVPELWLLEKDAESELEALFLDLSPLERSAISLFAGNNERTGKMYFVIRDERPKRTAPLFPAQSAIGFAPLLPQEGLYLHAHTRIVPTLPALIWRKALSLQSNRYTLILPPDRESQKPTEILQFPTQDFAPLEQFVHYQIGAHTEQISKLVQSSVFSLLFTPSEWSESQPAPPPPTPIQEVPEQAPKDTLVEPPSHQPANLEASKEHRSGRAVHSERLQQLEKVLQGKVRKNSPIPPRDWLTLSSLYQQEYEVNKDIYWLHEAIKTLDQVLYLDRRAEKAVEIESKVLQTLLQITPDFSFGECMQQLDRQSAQENPLLMRFAFRFRARMLLNTPENDEHVRALRQLFYQDLARTEEHLMIREFIIYVAGVAQYLEDSELFERARQRYRQLLSDAHRLQRELPEILMNY